MQAEERQVRAGLSAERVGFFTDAVLAIAITLLVIDIPKPDEKVFVTGPGVSKAKASGQLLGFLGDNIAGFISYVLAFCVLWILWRQHHALFDRIDRMSPGLVGWHLPLLMLIGFLPFPTALYDEHISNPVAAALFTLELAALFGCKTAAQRQALRDGLLNPSVDVEHFKGDLRIGWTMTWFYAATLIFCWWTPWVMIAWNAGPIAAGVLNRRQAAIRGV